MNKVLLKNLLELLRMKHEVEIRDEDGYRVFNCTSLSPALIPYLNREVIEWFAFDECKIVISIGEEWKYEGDDNI